jgi:hypothetical protein
VCSWPHLIDARDGRESHDRDATNSSGSPGSSVRHRSARQVAEFSLPLSDDGVVILPAAADEGIGNTAVLTAAARWFTALGNAKVTLANAHYGYPWFDAELVVTPGPRLRVTGAFAAVPDDSPSNQKLSFKVAALHVSEAVDDKVVLAAAAAGKLPALPKLATEDAGFSFQLPADDDRRPEHVVEFVDSIYDLNPYDHHPAVAVFGSAPTEQAVGVSAIHKLLGRWRGLKLATREGRSVSVGEQMLLRIGVSHAEGTFRVGNQTVTVPYRVLVVVMEPWATAADHGAVPTLVSAHFSVATR